MLETPKWVKSENPRSNIGEVSLGFERFWLGIRDEEGWETAGCEFEPVWTRLCFDRIFNSRFEQIGDNSRETIGRVGMRR